EAWHLENAGHHNGTPVGFRAGADARVARAWRALPGRGRDDIRIAMIDDGFDLAHPDLAGRCAARHDFTRRGPDVSPDWGDWHGTACAGLALGGGAAGAPVGAAPGARLVALRWGRDLSDREVEAWLDHAGRCEAAILSASWGPAARIYPLSTRKSEAIRRLSREGRAGRGCVVLFSVGAQGRDFDAPEGDPRRVLNGFAAHPDVVAVTATTSMDELAEGADRGACLWIAAPAGGAGGWGVVTSDVSGFVTQPDGRVVHRGEGPGARVALAGGPSAACALTAGVCALVLTANPALTSAELRALLAETARPLPDQRRDLPPRSAADGLASGEPAAGAGRDRRYGHGCVDAYAAVLAASQLPGARALTFGGDESGCDHLPAPVP
ncbi:MAG: S8 family serine peptidase, partial [Pseudomonadota bacterium]|nr:S8 family serine peptidase [Pseudomonadota bacterium]